VLFLLLLLLDLQAASSGSPDGSLGPHLGSGFSGYNSFMLAEASERDVAAWEVQLVLEYCDLGSLREELDQGLFNTEGACYVEGGEGRGGNRMALGGRRL
jgi:hypothetical protein